MYCDKCGKEIADDSNFCRYCGNKIQSESTVSMSAVVEEYSPYVDCGHCQGTGTCYRGNKNNSRASCDQCLMVAKVLNGFFADYDKKVVCSVCKGKGKVLL